MYPLRLILLCLSGVISSSAAAETNLTVSAERRDHHDRARELRLQELASLPHAEVVTANNYRGGATRFSGPLPREVASPPQLGRGDPLVMTALNDFGIEFPVGDGLDHDANLALRQNGETRSVREKGPCWVISPKGQQAELRETRYNYRPIWLLREIVVG